MNGIALGLAVLVSAGGVPTAHDTPRVVVAPAMIAFDLRDAVATARIEPEFRLSDRSRSLAPAGAVPSAQARATRPARTVRILAIAAGAFGGFLAGGAIGYAAASEPVDDDGVSGLRGVVIGAPIGAAVGGVIGYWLTK